MKKMITLLALILGGFVAFSQTTVYETGNGTGDGWTGWSAPVVTNCTGSVNGPGQYQFTGSSGNSYTLETYRQFDINSNDIDIWFDVLTQNATFSVWYSADNASYSQIGTQTVGAGFAVSSLIVPTFDPVSTPFYLKVKVSGTFSSPSSTNLYKLKIDAVINGSNTASVTPSSPQTIITGDNGNVLTVNESPTADSREWKYTTTSGTGYTSFSPAQTGTTYTPNFASAGTYYVVCESTFGGNTITTNEVMITVTDPSAIDQFEIGTSVIFSAGNLQITGVSVDYQVSIYDVSGKCIITQPNLHSFSMEPYKSGVYFINIVTNNEHKTIKVNFTK